MSRFALVAMVGTAACAGGCAPEFDTNRVTGDRGSLGREMYTWDIGQDIEHPSHKKGLLEQRPRAAAGALPPALVALDETGRSDFKLLAAGSRSIQREILRLTFLVEIFGAVATSSAMREVMQTGHVGAEYVEYVMRHKRGLVPHPPPLRLGNLELDAISLPEPDMSVYDDLSTTPMTRDPGEPPGLSANGSEDVP